MRSSAKRQITAVSAQTRAAGISGRLTQKPESKGTKDPSSSQIREAGQTVNPSKKGDSGKKKQQALRREMCVKNHQGRKARQKMAADSKANRVPQPKWLPTLTNFKRFLRQVIAEYERRIRS